MAGCSRRTHLAPQELYKDADGKFERGQLIAAQEEVERALPLYQGESPEWTWRFRVLEAKILLWRGLSKEALAVLEGDVPPPLRADPVAVRQKIIQGLASLYLQRFGDAERKISEAEQLATLHAPGLLGEVAQGRGLLFDLRKDYSSAEIYYRRALASARELKQTFLEINALGNIGTLYMRRQHYGEAIDAYETALELSRRLGNRTQIAKTVGNLGWCYFKLGDAERALPLFMEAQAVSAELGLSRDELVWLTNIGIIHHQQRDYATAETYYEKALRIAQKLENREAAAVRLNYLALDAIDTGRVERAAQYNREALALEHEINDRASELYSLLNEARIASIRRDFAQAERILREIIRGSAEDVSLRWEAEADLANVYVSEGKLTEADQQFRKAIETVDSARASLAKEEHRLSFLASATRFYNQYIDFVVSQGRSKEALQVAEHSRARTLAEGLGLDRPGNASLQAAFRPEQTARKLNTVILSYWLKPGHSYLWAVTAEKIALFRLPPDSEINAAVQAYRKALAGPRDVLESANSYGQKLYEMLVAPAQKLIPPGARVTIIADGSLHGLNFETLLAPAPTIHYWIEDAVIADAGSIEILAASARRPPAKTTSLLLIGDPVSPSSEYPALAQVKLEVARVQDHFPDGRRLVVAREKAVPRAYRESNPGRFAYIHFVAHGTASRISPLDSGVILSRDGDAYKLYARDIMQQPLRARLVTISACYGAGTRAYSGEGLVGLAWAFLRAGAHNVIAASWEVNDASTAQLMDDLYTALGKEQDPATALRHAKLVMLHSQTIYRRPFYWGAFQVYVGS